MAAGYAENQHAPGAWAFLIVALAAFGVPRIASWYGLSGSKGYLLTAALALLLIYGLVRLEVAGELMKVTWPTWYETRVSTIAVVIASLVAAVLLFCIDSVAYKLMVDWLPHLWGKL